MLPFCQCFETALAVLKLLPQKDAFSLSEAPKDLLQHRTFIYNFSV